MKQTIILIENRKIFVGHNRLSIMDPNMEATSLSDDKEILLLIMVRFIINLS